MKTADLIPLILLELNECDKYGFELTKNIETKSNGKIIIKQPTLYTLLKKLEKSKFIASYWQDSEIGGKRHYYKLTNNGKLQVSTLPSYDFLINNACNELDENEIDEPKEIQNEAETKAPSIMDELLNDKPFPSETILPTGEVFAENNIDTTTELEINVANTDILKNESKTYDEQFATNSNVMKFTEKVVPSSPENNHSNLSTTPQNNLLDVEFSIPKTQTNIQYVDYIDLKNNDNYKYGKKIANRLILQAIATSASLIAILILSTIVTMFTSRSGLFYFFYITDILFALFYPVLLIANKDKCRLKYQTKKYESKIKLRLSIGLSILLLVLLVCIFVNIYIGNNSISLILNIKNFENFYAPLIIVSVYFLDVLYNHLLLSKIK